MALGAATVSDFTTWLRSDFLQIVLIALAAILLTRFVTWLRDTINRSVDAGADAFDKDTIERAEQAKHRHALAQVLTWTVIVLIDFVAAFSILRHFGLPLTSLVAPATIVGVAVGFGAQRVVQDLLAGFFIITERQYGFGDVIRISPPGTTAGVRGTVEEVTLRTTRIRTMNGELLMIPNGEIHQVTNLSRDWARAVIDVPVPSEVDIDEVNTVLRAVGNEALLDERLRPLLLDAPSVMGIESINLGFVTIRMVARTLPGRQFEVAGELRIRVAAALQAHGIALPATFTAPPYVQPA